MNRVLAALLAVVAVAAFAGTASADCPAHSAQTETKDKPAGT